MNTQLERPKGHTTYGEDSHVVHDQDVGLHPGRDHDEHHGEKKSVLKKVKAKAKKIKDTIKEHVGHGHEVHEDEDDDEMDTDPETHGHGTLAGQEGVARQHEPKFGGKTAGEGASVISKPGAYQTFDPTTARYTPGQDQTMGWSRTDTGTPKVPEEEPYAPRNTPVGDVLSGGGSHSTGHLEVRKKGPSAKYGGFIERPTGVEADPRVPRDVGGDLHSATNQAKTTDTTGIAAQSVMPGLHRSNLGERDAKEGRTHIPTSKPQGGYTTAAQSVMPELHRSNLGERVATEGLTHVPTSKPQGGYTTAAQSVMPELHRSILGERVATEGPTHVPTSKPQGGYTTLETKTASYVPGQEETLAWSRTETGRLRESEEQSNALKNPAGHLGRTHGARAEVERDSGKLRGILGSPEVLEKESYGLQGPGEENHPQSFGSNVTDLTGKSMADTGRMRESKEYPNVLKNTQSATHASRSHVTRAEDEREHNTQTATLADRSHVTRAEDERDSGKIRGMIGGPVVLERNPQGPRGPVEELHPGNYESKVTDPTGRAAQSVMPGLHRGNLGERVATEGLTHVPTSKPQSGLTHVPISKPQSGYTTLEAKTASYVPGQEETLGWSRTETGRLRELEEQSNALKNPATIGHLGRAHDTRAEEVRDSGKLRGMLGRWEVLEKEPYGLQGPGEENHPQSLGSNVTDLTGKSMTNTGRMRELKEYPNVFKNTQTATHAGRSHVTRAEDERDSGELPGIIDGLGVLERDPQGPRGTGEELQPGNYESKVTDPTGRGGEEIGISPILHQMDKMNIHDKSLQKLTPKIGQEETLCKPEYAAQHEKISTGSHDQFSPEPVTSKTSPFLGTSDSGFELNSNAPGSNRMHENAEHNQGSYTEKIASAATTMANKAKQATSSVASKLGYDGSTDNQSEPGGYGSMTTSIADKAVQAKDDVATKLGYGGPHQGQVVQEGEGEGESKGGSIVDTVKNTLVYNKVAAVGSTLLSKVHGSATDNPPEGEGVSTGVAKDDFSYGESQVGQQMQQGSAVASKVQGSGHEHEKGPTTGTDKGVSVKEYFVEKLKPGEEDKALSDVITEAIPLHKRKEEDASKTVEEVETTKVVITGRVTESDEVARRLGRSAEKSYDGAGVGFAKPGKGVMDRIYEATNSWFQKSGEDPTPENTKGNQGSPGTASHENEQKRVEEPRLQ